MIRPSKHLPAIAVDNRFWWTIDFGALLQTECVVIPPSLWNRCEIEQTRFIEFLGLNHAPYTTRNRTRLFFAARERGILGIFDSRLACLLGQRHIESDTSPKRK